MSTDTDLSPGGCGAAPVGARGRFPWRAALLTALLAGRTFAGRAAEPTRDNPRAIVFPSSPTEVTVMLGDEIYFTLAFAGWGPQWAWLGFSGRTTTVAGTSRLMSSAKTRSGARIRFDVAVERTLDRRVRVTIKVSTDRDTEVTAIIAALRLHKAFFDSGKAIVHTDGQASRSVAYPFGRKGFGNKVSRIGLADGKGRQTEIRLTPSCDVPTDGEARIVLANGRFTAANPRQVTLGIDLPFGVDYCAAPEQLPADASMDDWYEFKPADDVGKKSELDMTGWLDAPAGGRGRIRRDGERLMYGTKPIKIWGVNVCYRSCAPPKDLAQRRARFYARQGINAVRLHKFADGGGWAGIQSGESCTRYDPDGLDRMDYFVAQLKEHGIFTSLSAHFGTLGIGPADLPEVPYAEEFSRMRGKPPRIKTPPSTFFYSPELQALHIRQITNLLKHTNPYTGLTYARDPAVAFVEIINEQSVLFYTSMTPLKKSPTLRKRVARRFSAWLRKKYHTQAALEKAWGRRAFDCFVAEGFPKVGENLDKNNILPLGNPWFWDPDQLRGSRAFRRRRLLDTLEFLYELQCRAYAQAVRALRETGYQGEIIGSNWQAGRAFSHYLNLHADYRVGLIDRHNYFGGGSGRWIRNASMLDEPGGGILSSGMQQAIDRPFMLSEWIHVFPNEWGAEGPAIIGAYGLGLQGWDASFLFQNRDNAGFQDRLGMSRWEIMTPQVLGIFPAVARMVLRGDVAESPVSAVRYVCPTALADGRIGFEDRTAQKGDVKVFAGDKVPAAALAVVRCVVAFTDEFRDTPEFDLSRFTANDTYTSATGQLRWHRGNQPRTGYFTLDSPGTKAVVGFAPAVPARLGRVTITPSGQGFAAIFATAKAPGETIANAAEILIVAMGRARNTGAKVFRGVYMTDRGHAPIRLEPVRAGFRIDRPGAGDVVLLDHDGVGTNRTLPIMNRSFRIDGARDHTPYYLVRFRTGN